MKITTLIENSLREDKQQLYNEHGLSFFIETPQGNILFDTGKTGEFIKNAEALGIDLNKTDYLVLSHGHYDHCGGVRRFLDTFHIKPEFYVSKYFFSNSHKYHYSHKDEKLDFSSHKDSEYRYIGIDFDKSFIEDKHININYVDKDVVKIGDSVYIFSNFERNFGFEKLNSSMKMKKDNKYVTDSFEDEIVVALETKKGLLVLLGCSHPGVLNIITTIAKKTGKKIYGIMGGTHLVEADDERIEKTVQILKKMNVNIIGVSHCTGEKAVEVFKEKCNGFFVNSTGTEVNLI